MAVDENAVRAVIMDLDGTMLDTETALKKVVLQILHKYDKATGWEPNEFEGWGKQAIEACEDLVTQTKLPITASELLNLCEPMLQTEFRTCSIMPGVKRLVAHLKDSGVKVAIVTSSSHKMFQVKQGDCPLKKAMFEGIECVICADDVQKGSPSILWVDMNAIP